VTAPALVAPLASAVATPSTGRGVGLLWRVLKPALLALVSVGVVLCLWVGFIKAFDLSPEIAKDPGDVLRFFTSGGSRGQPTRAVYDAVGTTLLDAGLGLVTGLAGAVALTVVFVLSRPVEAAVMPVALVLRAVPLPAMTPLITLVFGFGYASVIVISGIVVFFPALVTMALGLRSTPRQSVDLCKAYGAGRATVMRRVMLPSALPSVFASARVGVPGALIGALLAEFLATGTGSGYDLSRFQNQYSYDSLWATVALLTFVSVLIYYAVAAVEGVVLARFGAAPRRA